MRADELRGRRVAIWGLGREGRAAIDFLHARDPGIALTVLDDAETGGDCDQPMIRGRNAVAASIADFDVVVKSPGISLYDPLVQQAQAKGVRFTSLLNLWFADAPAPRTICVTGTKGKSTTAALIAHILRGNGRSVGLAGNIGIPVTELPLTGLDFAVIEISSYQAADFAGTCNLAVLTMLAQEHLDWHGSVAAYHRDKLNLLHHARHIIINLDLRGVAGLLHAATIFDPRANLAIANRYLARPHNHANLSAAIAVAGHFGIDQQNALRAAEDFQPLPHRQQEIGEVDGVLYVDDSISTTPESAIAALQVYRDRAVTIIVGGHDRGIDYTPLVEHLSVHPPCGIVALGPSGARIHALLAPSTTCRMAQSMHEAVDHARAITPRGGVVLLSPAAPSFGIYRSYIERGQDFACCAGLQPAP